MSRQIMTFFFFNILLSGAKSEGNTDFLSALEKKMDIQLFEYANNIVQWLYNINYKTLNNSDSATMNEIKPKIDSIKTEGRGMKMISLALIPIIFLIGMTSTWIILTAFLAAKSVAIGLILLAFKIVVSSIKIASFITAFKIKKYHGELLWPAYHDHHGYHHDHHSHIPDYGVHHSHGDFGPHHSHTDFGPNHSHSDFGPHHSHTDFDTHHTHTPDFSSHHTHEPDLTSRKSYKPNWIPHPTPYKVNPPSLTEIDYVDTKKADKRLGIIKIKNKKISADKKNK